MSRTYLGGSRVLGATSFHLAKNSSLVSLASSANPRTDPNLMEGAAARHLQAAAGWAPLVVRASWLTAALRRNAIVARQRPIKLPASRLASFPVTGLIMKKTCSRGRLPLRFLKTLSWARNGKLLTFPKKK